jgi:biotin synthase
MTVFFVTLDDALNLFNKRFNDLIYHAHSVFRESFPDQEIQISTLFSIKTGGCPENCGYCTQSAHYKTGLEKEPLSDLETVLEAAQKAKDIGATRFCLGAAWRGPNDRDLDLVCEMVKGIKKLGLETCVTLGLLKDEQAEKLKTAGLDFYNHNIDTSREHYQNVITTRTFEDRLETLKKVKKANIHVCCGGILGIGESSLDRIKMLLILKELEVESIPINKLIPMPGTPLGDTPPVDSFEFIKIIALCRILMPASFIRLSAGRESMNEELQALCFFAGANSIFYGDVLLTAKNPQPEKDDQLLDKLGLKKAALHS